MSKKKKKKPKNKTWKSDLLSPGIFSEAEESDGDELSPKKWKTWRQKSNLTSRWGGNWLVTLKTPYGEASYVETPEMRRGKTKSNFGDFKGNYLSTLGGTGGGDYLQIFNKLKDR